MTKSRRDESAKDYATRQVLFYRSLCCDEFKAGWDACEKELYAEVKGLVAAGVSWLKSRPYHDCVDNGEPECEQCVFENALDAYRAAKGQE
jgi:hypothetical protein